MKKLIITIILVIGYKISLSQFTLIQSSGPDDACYPATVTLSVVTPQAGYTYNWFMGGYGCPGPGFATPWGSGSSIQVFITGQFFCYGMPPGGGNPEISNPINIRNLPGMPGSLFMPAPGLYTGNNNCVTSASLCIPEIYYQNWPNTIIKWYKNNVLISGASSGTYTATSEGYYKYTITSGCTTALSDSTLVTSPPIASITSGGSTTICSGSTVALNANSGIGYSYQWKKDLTNISGATLSSYQAAASGGYSVVITSSCGTASSNSITVTANPLPSAAITPSGPTTFCSGGSVTLNAPIAANRSYQWKKGANLISGATLSSYTATTGGNYRVIVTNTVTGCSKTSNSATTVTVNALPAATITPQGPTTFCAGGSVVLQANPGAGLTYKWKKGSNFISGATLSNYTATTGGNYRVQVTNSNGCSKVSGLVAVSVPCKEGESVKVGEGESELEMNIFPNPNSGEFTIKFSNKPTSPIQIELTDEIGKVVKRFQTGDKTIVIKETNLAKGIYCLTVRNKGEVAIKKINIVK